MNNIQKLYQLLNLMQLKEIENEIKEMFLKKGFHILREKIHIEKSEAEKFYKVHETKPFTMIYVATYLLVL